jgi:hypothetical protein
MTWAHCIIAKIARMFTAAAGNKYIDQLDDKEAASDWPNFIEINVQLLLTKIKFMVIIDYPAAHLFAFGRQQSCLPKAL